MKTRRNQVTIALIAIVLMLFYFIGFFAFYKKETFEMNLNGESGNLVWVRVPRTWVPLELKDSLECIYAPMLRSELGVMP
jgi:hypothetical protein